MFKLKLSPMPDTLKGNPLETAVSKASGFVYHKHIRCDVLFYLPYPLRITPAKSFTLFRGGFLLNPIYFLTLDVP